MTHPLKVIKTGLPAKLLRETLNRPWMRLFVFLEDGPLARTPEHYKKFIYDWKVVEPSPVHFIPKPGIWERISDGRIVPVQNIPIPLKYPHEMHQMLWGGEAVVKGFFRKKRKSPRIARYWVPGLHETVVYSKILDKYMKVTVTERALDLIDQHYGLDNYILKSPPCDLMSELALKLRREMLYTLAHKTFDPVKRNEVYEEYKQYLIPEEEIEWYGLTLREAYRKQSKLEEQAEKTGPYKHIFRKEFIEYLKTSAEIEDAKSRETAKKGRISGLSIFSSKD